ncbi:MAG: hypothetical protein WCJ35_27980 [Planctomycetota bacterium]
MIRRAIFVAFLVCIATPAFAADEKAKAAPPSDQDDPIGCKLSERIGPFLQTPFVPFNFEVEARMRWKKEYDRLAVDEKIHYCVFQLRNESWYETGSFYTDAPYSKEPEATASRELIRLGRPAMPQLLVALNSRVRTKSYPSRQMQQPWLVQDAALDAIENIACRFFRRAVPFKVSNAGEKYRQKIRNEVAAWWEQNKGFDEVQWAKDALLSETTAHDEKSMAIDSLYRRLGKESYPWLVKAYHRLPKGREDAGVSDETKRIKSRILHWLLKAPTENEKAAFASAVQDAPLLVRIEGAKGLWAIGDPSGLDVMVKETEERLLKDTGSTELDCEYGFLVSFLIRCKTPRSRETVCKCLSGRNPYLRKRAIGSVPSLRMEKAVFALTELFDDPFVLSGSSAMVIDNALRTVPPTRVCDSAAREFTRVVPDAPRFDGSTAETQQHSIEKLKQWWKENGGNLKWDEKRGVLALPKKE